MQPLIGHELQRVALAVQVWRSRCTCSLPEVLQIGALVPARAPYSAIIEQAKQFAVLLYAATLIHISGNAGRCGCSKPQLEQLSLQGSNVSGPTTPRAFHISIDPNLSVRNAESSSNPSATASLYMLHFSSLVQWQTIHGQDQHTTAVGRR